jgi:aminoglycoside phosphotransferase (APT) family kinase protein
MRFDAAARNWIEAVCGPGARVLAARPLRGGVSSVVHGVVVATAHGNRHLVLRRIEDDSPFGAKEIETEMKILDALSGPLVPRMIDADSSGRSCGYPASIQTRLPGRPTPAPRSVESWIDGLASAVRTVRQMPLDGRAVPWLPTFEPWFPDDTSPPEWTTNPSAWSEVRDLISNGPIPISSDTALVHRDLHPGNVLFHRGKLSGIVDWTNASTGPVEVDISRCRVQIAILAGIGAADEFLRRCKPMFERYDPAWDALVSIEISPWLSLIRSAYRSLGHEVAVTSMQNTLHSLVANALTDRGGL